MRDYIILLRHNFIDYFPERIPPVFLVLLVWIIIQFIKIIIDSIVEKRFCLDHIFISWWFPSFHTGVASSVTVLALLADWIWSVSFAVALTFSMLFAYDAMNVRYQTWKHAEYLNAIRIEVFPYITEKQDFGFLREVDEQDFTDGINHLIKEISSLFDTVRTIFNL